MIVDMKKVTIFVTEDDSPRAVDKLRDLGVLHVDYVNPPVSDDVNWIEEKIRQTEQTLNILENYVDELSPPEETVKEATPRELKDYSGEIVKKTLNLREQEIDLLEKIENKKEILSWYDTWGKIKKEDLDDLEERGVYVRLYRTGQKTYDKLSDEKQIYKVNESPNWVYLALITRDPEEKLNLQEETLPSISFEKAKTEYEELQQKLENTRSKLKNLSSDLPAVKKYYHKLHEELEFARVESGMGTEEEISYLEGFCPVDSIDKIKSAAADEGWGYLIREPEDPREVPTKLSDSIFSRLVDPIYKFMGTLPGYNEFDISTAFLAFFAVFVALIVGDAAYGLIYLLATATAHKKFSENVAGETFTLFYILSISTIVWGLLTGTIFGVEQLQELPVLQSIILEPVRTFADNEELLMFITFSIGALQLAIGHLLRLLKSLFKPQALAEAGWMIIIGTMLFVVEMLVLGGEMTGGAISNEVLLWSLGAGAVLVVLFENYKPGEFLWGVASTMGSLPMDIINSFADIVSYIRLFAVGLATVVIMESFNQIALEVAGGFDNFLIAFLVAAVILILGHGLNLILCLMSIVVHGIRLNMLEFSNHVGMEWTGSRYDPFSHDSGGGS